MSNTGDYKMNHEQYPQIFAGSWCGGEINS